MTAKILQTMLHEAVAENFGKSNVPMPQDVVDYADSVVEFLRSLGLHAHRVNEDHHKDRCVWVRLREEGKFKKQLSIFFYYEGSDKHHARAVEPGTIEFVTDVSGHCQRHERGKWPERDQFLAEKLGKWISLYAPKEVLEKAWPDRKPVVTTIGETGLKL